MNVADVISLPDVAATRSLRESLAQSDKGVPLPTVANLIAILRHDPLLKGLLAYNEFTGEYLINAPAPAPDDDASYDTGSYPRPWTDTDAILLQAYIQRMWAPRVSRETVFDAMTVVAGMQGFHPVRQWLDGLVWDGVQRLESWLSVAFGADASPYHTDVGVKLLVAAVRRVRRPGCKFDHMLVLEGEQGIGKSTAIAKLFGVDWFSDNVPHDLASKDAALALAGMWCLEMAEIDQLIRSEVETIKGFLSRAVDRFRPPYGRAVVVRPRQCVIVGTTNNAEYLRDSTGNRRFWPVACRYSDTAWIEANREQLWAEAAALEAAGEPIWLTDAESQATSAEMQAGRLIEDAWEERIREWLSGRVEVTVAKVLTDCLDLSARDQNKSGQMRVGAILRGLGWERRLLKREQVVTRVWVKGNHQEEIF